MGMSASQVRFLSLQSRKNNIGLNLMTLSNRRTALSRDMKRVAANYNNAMNQKLIKWTNDSGMTYNDINYDLLMKPNAMNSTLPYIVTDAQGRVVLDSKNIILDGSDTGVSYRDLATMISLYSGVTGGITTYNNNVNLIGEGSVTPTGSDDSYAITIASEGVTGGVANEANPYQIVSSTTNMQAGSLQYDVMYKLGLLSNDDLSEIKDIMIGLYGTEVDGGGPYPVTSLMGQYYFAQAKLAAYEAFQDEVKTYVIAGITDKSKDIDEKSYKSYNTKTLTNVTNTTGKYEFSNNQHVTTPSIVEFTLSKDKDTVASDLLKKIDFSNAEGSFNSTNAVLYERLIKSDDNAVIKYDASGGDIKFTYENETSLRTIFTDITFEGLGVDVQTTDGGYLDEQAWDISGFTILDKEGHPMSDKGWDGDLGTDYRVCGTVQNGHRFTDVYNDDYRIYIPLYTSGEHGSDGEFKDHYEDMYTRLTNWCNLLKTALSDDSSGCFDTFAAKKAAELTLQTFWGQLNMEPNSNNKNWDDDTGDYDGNGNTLNEAKIFATDYNEIVSRRDTSGTQNTTAAVFSLKNLFNTFLTYYNAAATNETVDLADIDKTYNDSVDRDDNSAPGKFYYSYGHEVSLGEGDPKVNIMSKTDSNGGYQLTVVHKTEGDTLINGYNETKYKNKIYTTYEIYQKDDKYYTDANYTIELNNNNISQAKKIQEVVEAYEVKLKDGVDTTAQGYNADDADDYEFISGANTMGRKDTIKYKADGSIESFERACRYEGEWWYGRALSDNLDTVKDNYDEQIKNMNIANFAGTVKVDGTDVRFMYECSDDGDLGSLNAERAVQMFINYSAEDDPVTAQIANKVKDNSTYANEYIRVKVNVQAEIDALKTACDTALANVNEAQANLDKLLASKQSKIMDYFNALFKMISERGWVYDENVNNPDNPSGSQQYLNAKLQNNLFFITEVESVNGEDFDYATKVVNNVSKVIEIYDDNASNVALSQYEAEKADITAKEKVIDMRINKLEAEEEAISTEMDSLKSIINDNIQNTFKIFS